VELWNCGIWPAPKLLLLLLLLQRLGSLPKTPPQLKARLLAVVKQARSNTPQAVGCFRLRHHAAQRNTHDQQLTNTVAAASCCTAARLCLLVEQFLLVGRTEMVQPQSA
jgi:hypothetical protein